MIEINNTTKERINKAMIVSAAEKFLSIYRIKGKDVSIAFVGDKCIRKLNKIYRGKDKSTDVLSFDGEGDLLGEILVNPHEIRKQAKKVGTSFRYELLFIIIHGFLHLVGMNDDTEDRRIKMIREGERIMKKIC